MRVCPLLAIFVTMLVSLGCAALTTPQSSEPPSSAQSQQATIEAAVQTTVIAQSTTEFPTTAATSGTLVVPKDQLEINVTAYQWWC